MATAELVSSLEKFVTFARTRKGDEKSEGQAFIHHFFRALGHAGAVDAARRPGGKKFADILWPERVLIEMKSRGQNLEKHYYQALEKSWL